MTTDTLRTERDIVAVLREPEETFDFRDDTLLSFLPYAQAKAFLKDTVTEAEWATVAKLLTRANVLGVMYDYMDFAWGKARNHRGLSALRSVSHYRWWGWLLGDDDMVKLAEADDTGNYGVKVLQYVCDRYGFTPPDSPMFIRMAAGLPCRREGCGEGCGG